MKSAHIVFSAVFVLAATVHAQSTTEHADHHPPAASAATAPTSDGEVRKIDKEQGKLTLKHGPIANLDMPGMTMVFKVSSPRLLEAIKPGDQVKFAVENRNGALTVTAIEVVK